MTFIEKSAWTMVLALCLCFGLYALFVVNLSLELGHLVPPYPPVLMVASILLAMLAAGSHILLALLAPADANASTDERERQVIEKAGHWSGLFFGAGIILSMGVYLFSRHGDVFFYSTLTALVSSQALEYLLQIFFLRRSV